METLVNLVEILGGLSVFISLIFLAIQIRLSNELARADLKKTALFSKMTPKLDNLS
jgi:competence protein ComGF